MRRLRIEIEINGESVHVGEIAGNDYQDAKFAYADAYLQRENSNAISLSLPLQTEAFSAERTRNFFEGLLPEGFIKRCIAQTLKSDENDYLSILAALGSECLGAIKVCEQDTPKMLPMYEKLTDAEVKALAQEGATESVQLVTKAHLSLTGASGKVGLYYDANSGQWYFPVGEAPSTHIVKQSHVRLKKIVANEKLCLLTAKYLGIDTPESFIVHVDSENAEDVLFATRRYDRYIDASSKILNDLPVPYRLHQEDFAQALGIAAKDKYEKNNAGYLKRMYEVVRAYSSEPIIDQVKLWDICIFNYLIGNTDNHIKNVSLLYSKDLQECRLAPAYDIVSTVVYDSSTENMAFSIGGVYNINEIDKACFLREAKNIGLGANVAAKRFDDMVKYFHRTLEAAEKLLLLEGFSEVEEIAQEILRKGGIKNYIKV